MVVVVQLFAADPQAPWGEVGRGVVGFEIAIAPPVAEAVDHAGCPERDPQHLDCPHRHAGEAEQGEAEEQIGKHTSELQSLMRRSYAVFCLKKKNTKQKEQ